MGAAYHMMKIVICTTPIRPIPTDYPPFGSLAIIQSLRAAGWDPAFFDIDALRPPFEEVERYFSDMQPDVVGISAVVSTAYGYTKNLAQMIKRVAPRARIIVGGNLGASAEILHRMAGVDVCVVGEGETVAVNLLRHYSEQPGELPTGVRGITFLDGNGKLRFTGFELALAPGQVFHPDYDILERYSRISNFIGDPLQRPDFGPDPRSRQPHRLGKKMGTVLTAKGCVARCTFCHRWDKGYRAIPVDDIIHAIRELKRRYNVGFIQFSDDNFGSDRRQLQEFIRAIKAEDVLYTVGGVRVRSVTPQILRDLRDSGCVSLYYGMESGSPAILEVMEKKATLEDNRNAARWTHEAGLYTIFQLVLGMPGECDRTIQETIEFLKEATARFDESPINRMSINYIQALPGTPVYEFARYKGLIGKSLADEERYLLSISDINAADETKFLNFTDSDHLSVQSWRRRITLETTHHYRKVRNLPRPPLRDVFHDLVLRKFWPSRYKTDRYGTGDSRNDYTKGGYFNLQRNLNYHLISAYCYPLGPLIVWAWLLRQELKRLPFSEFLSHFIQFLKAKLSPSPEPMQPESLRRLLQRLAPKPLTPDEEAMAPLREGR